jgi:transposase
LAHDGPFKEFEQITLAAWWNYQRDRIYVKSAKAVGVNARQSTRKRTNWKTHLRVNKSILCPELLSCPLCGGECTERSRCKRMLYDLLFCRSSVKRWVVEYRFRHYWCGNCQRRVGEPREFWPQSHFGRNLVAYVLQQTIDLIIPFLTVQKNLSRFFRLDIPVDTLILLKRTAAKQYKAAYEDVLKQLINGNLLHVDETQVSIRGKTAYVWVFTNLHDVAYMYAESREGGFLHEMLKDFKGVLVSDFFGAYDSVNCQQQKCLVHLMRDLNDDVLKHPYDEELKVIVRDFAALLRPIVETIAHKGLKRRFLRKFQTKVDQFYDRIEKLDCQSERAAKCTQRFQKNRGKLFTFLSHDDVSWNNNNAEHAVRAFAKLRDVVRGSFTEDSVRNYLLLLSICQTCKYSSLDFFEFLRSGENDIHAFAESRRRRPLRRQTTPPTISPADSGASAETSPGT